MARSRKRKIAYEEKSVAEKKLDFKRHLRTYLAMGVFFFLLNAFTAFGAWWFYWPLLGWGIGVALQGMSLYGPLRDPDDETVKQERLEPLPDLRDQPEPMELRELQTNKPYREEDLV